MSSPTRQKMVAVMKKIGAVYEAADKDRLIWVSKFMPLAAEMVSLSMIGVPDKKGQFKELLDYFGKFVPGTSAETFHKALLEIKEFTDSYRADRSYLNRIRLINLGFMGKKNA